MVKVEVDKKSMAAFQHNIKQLIAVTKEPVEDILRQQGRLFALEAAERTFRFGNTVKHGKKHKDDVEASILTTYAPAGGKKGTLGYLRDDTKESPAKQWRNALRSGNIAKLNEMVSKFNLSRTYGGKRVVVINWDKGNRHTRRLKGAGAKNTIYLVADKWKSVTDYIKRKKANVGEAKSGWVKAARMLGHQGNSKTPAWMHKGHRTRGHGSVRGTGSKAVLTVAHYGKYGFSKTTMSGLFRSRANSIARNVELKLKHAGREVSKAQRQSRKISKSIIK